MIGSMITAAMRSPSSANRRSTAASSFHGSTRSDAPYSAGIPVEAGSSAGRSAGPASASAGCADQWIVSAQPW